MTMNNDEQQVIALAATLQALSSVEEVAVKGQFDERHALPIFHSLATYNPEDTLSAFGGDIYQLQYGIRQLKRLFGDELNRDLAQYLLAVVSIELKLVKNPAMRQILQQSLATLSAEINNFSITESENDADSDDERIDDEDVIQSKYKNTEEFLVSPEVVAELADTYKQTASQTEPRIMIKGNHQFLQNEQSANQIRALLLGALRAVGFFRHYGGKRMDFMLKRKQYLAICETLT